MKIQLALDFLIPSFIQGSMVLLRIPDIRVKFVPCYFEAVLLITKLILTLGEGLLNYLLSANAKGINKKNQWIHFTMETSL